MTRHAADPGSTLADRLAHPAPMTPVEVAAVGAQVAAELDDWHRSGTCHRALGPDRIEIGAAPDGRLLARLRPPTDPAAPAPGSDDPAELRYRAPEQLTGRPVGPAADVYALGVVLLDGLVGPHEVPFVPDDLGAAWRYLLAGMIAVSPADRPTAATVTHTLAGVPGVGVGPAGGGADTTGVGADPADSADPGTGAFPSPASAPGVAPRSKLLPGGAQVAPTPVELPKPRRLGRLRPPVTGRRRSSDPDTRPPP